MISLTVEKKFVSHFNVNFACFSLDRVSCTHLYHPPKRSSWSNTLIKVRVTFFCYVEWLLNVFLKCFSSLPSTSHSNLSRSKENRKRNLEKQTCDKIEDCIMWWNCCDFTGSTQFPFSSFPAIYFDELKFRDEISINHEKKENMPEHEYKK